jgi:hypothetical protein
LPCSDCRKNLPIVNVRYQLCNNCNSIRLTGKTKQERQFEQQQRYKTNYLERNRGRIKEHRDIEDPVVFKPKQKSTRIKAQTTEEALIKKQLSELKKEIELEAVQDNEYYCRGCGNSHPGLDKSHILSVGRFKALELVKANMQLMCRKCHEIWESGTIEQQMRLHCFIENNVFIYHYDHTTFNKFLTRIEEYRAWLIPGTDTKEISTVDHIINEIYSNVILL